MSGALCGLFTDAKTHAFAPDDCLAGAVADQVPTNDREQPPVRPFDPVLVSFPPGRGVGAAQGLRPGRRVEVE